METKLIESKLIEKAILARDNARAFYSGFKIGSAVLCEDGSIYDGFNIEADNSSVALCAERVAIAHAMLYTNSRFKSLALASEDMITPCGICRQFLSEFKTIKIIVANLKGDFKIYSILELLPVPYVRGRKLHP